IGSFKGSLESTESEFVFLGEKVAQDFLGLKDKVSEVSILLRDPTALSLFESKLKLALPELDVKTWKQLEPFVDALTQLQNRFLLFWFSIVIVAVSFGVLNTLFMSIFERIPEFSLVQALGMPPLGIVKQVAIESAIILFIGVLSGNVLALISVTALSNGVDLAPFAQGVEMTGFGRVIYPRVNVQDWVIANSLTYFICLIACFYPAFRAVKLAPINASRSL
ncbi:MAG: FtsX-like permease family protein, partial [Bdellovibrionales bacterium]|nr:FtsX-like permease family protein [Bdellovibrionales bacterium]